MKHKKVQTTVRNGKSSTMNLGWVDSTRLDQDIESERQWFSRLALQPSPHPDGGIQTVEVADKTIVALYESGSVRIINYVSEEEEK